MGANRSTSGLFLICTHVPIHSFSNTASWMQNRPICFRISQKAVLNQWRTTVYFLGARRLIRRIFRQILWSSLDNQLTSDCPQFSQPTLSQCLPYLTVFEADSDLLKVQR